MRKPSGVDPGEIARVEPKDLWEFLSALDPEKLVHFGLIENVFCEYWRARFGNYSFRVNMTAVRWVDGNAEMPSWTKFYAMSLVNWPHGLRGAESITVERAMEVLAPLVAPMLASKSLLARRSHDPLLTVAEAAQYRGVTTETIRRAIKRGSLKTFPFDLPNDPPHRRGHRIKRSELDRYGAEAETHRNLREYRSIVDRQHADGYLTIAEAATLMGISRKRIETLCRHRVLCRVDNGGFWFVLAEDVQRLLSLRHQAAQRDPMSR